MHLVPRIFDCAATGSYVITGFKCDVISGCFIAPCVGLRLHNLRSKFVLPSDLHMKKLAD